MVVSDRRGGLSVDMLAFSSVFQATIFGASVSTSFPLHNLCCYNYSLASTRAVQRMHRVLALLTVFGLVCRVIVGVYTVLSVSIVYGDIVHPLLFRNADGSMGMPFLPLMQLSVVCALLLLRPWGYACLRLLTC